MPSGLKRFQKAESLHFIAFRCYCIPARKPVAKRSAHPGRETSQLSHSSRKRRGLNGAHNIAGEHKLKNLTGPPAEDCEHTFIDSAQCSHSVLRSYH